MTRAQFDEAENFTVVEVQIEGLMGSTPVSIVKYSPQSLTLKEQTQARTNISAEGVVYTESGDIWCTQYYSGLIVQGGHVTPEEIEQEIVFIKPYTNTPIVNVTCVDPEGTSKVWIKELNIKGFKLGSSGSSMTDVVWSALGNA